MSDIKHGSDSNFVKPIIANTIQSENQVALSALSEKDKPWDIHRNESDKIEDYYKNTHYNKYADRIHFCSEFLDFVLKEHEAGEIKLKLKSARFCRVRTCMVCSWRKSLMYKARVYKSLPKFIEDYPKYRFLFLTLTVKNCEIIELRETIKWMNESFTRMSRLKDFPAEGWIKSVEVTKGCRGDAHPHFHLLLTVKSTYFSGRAYLSQQKWCDLWKRSLRVDYQPVLDVQAVKSRSSLVPLVAEIVKYQTKPTHLIGYGTEEDRKWFLEYTNQIINTKAISIGGIFREYFRELDKNVTNEDLLLHNEDTELSEDDIKLLFKWSRKDKLYLSNN